MKLLEKTLSQIEALKSASSSQHFTKRIIIIFVYSIIGIFVGALFFKFGAPQSYLDGVNALIEGNPLYLLSEPKWHPYPPFLYGLLTIIFFLPVYVLGLELSVFSYPSMVLLQSLFIFSTVTIYILGLAALDSKHHKTWMLFVLVNPLIIFTSILVGQSDTVVALGIILALYGWHQDIPWIMGAGFAGASVIKLYPIIYLLGSFWYYPDYRRDLLAGAIPIFAFTVGLFLGLPNAFRAFINPNHLFGLGVIETEPIISLNLFDITVSTSPSLLSVVLLLAGITWSLGARVETPIERIFLLPLPVLFLRAGIGNRWVPILLFAGLIALTQEQRQYLNWGVAISVILGIPALIAGLIYILGGVPHQGWTGPLKYTFNFQPLNNRWYYQLIISSLRTFSTAGLYASIIYLLYYTIGPLPNYKKWLKEFV